MAWYAKVNNLGEVCHIEHGSKVTIKNDFFFEGAFNSDLSPIGLKNSNICLGSGYFQIAGTPTFVTPSHTLEGLFLVKKDQQCYVSNSNVIAYYLADLTPSHIAVKKAWRIKYGLDQVPQVIEKLGDKEIIKISFFNFSLIHHKLVLIEKPADPDFFNFDDYYSYLVKEGKRLIENFENLNNRGINVVSTISTGFDSVACLAIAKELGCKNAVSLQNGRGNVRDDGSDISKSINIDCKSYLRPFSEKSTTSRIAIDHASIHKCAEFVAAGTLAEDVCYLPFEDTLNDTLLLTGFQGDRVWGKKFIPTTKLDRGDISGSSLGEFRLRTGFIHWPLPFIGCKKNIQMLDITLSDEMKPYINDSNYNKPIPIRIAENANIPRKLFGLKKKAASVLFDETPSALPVAIYLQQIKYGLRENTDFENTRCIDLCSSRNLSYNFSDLYHSFYAQNKPQYSEKINFDIESNSIDIFSFGRTIALIKFNIDCESFYVDALGEFFPDIYSHKFNKVNHHDYENLKKFILPKLRDFSNSRSQFIHFRYSSNSDSIQPFYDKELQFKGKLNDYLSSIWQGKSGVI